MFHQLGKKEIGLPSFWGEVGWGKHNRNSFHGFAAALKHKRCLATRLLLLANWAVGLNGAQECSVFHLLF